MRSACITCDQPRTSGWFCDECYVAYRRTKHAQYGQGEENVQWGASRVRRVLEPLVKSLSAENYRLQRELTAMRLEAARGAAGVGVQYDEGTGRLTLSLSEDEIPRRWFARGDGE